MRVGLIDVGDSIVKELAGYDGRYLICSDGTVISMYRYARIHGRIVRIEKPKKLKPSFDKRGYEVVNLYRYGHGPKNCKVHRLVATTFMENPWNKKCVCHKDNNPRNNNLDNLYWGTDQENQKQAWDDGLHHSEMTIKQIAKDGRVVAVYKSQSEASRRTGICQQNISKCIAGERRMAGGFIWRRLD